MIRAVIFDMDGLLIDSEPLWQHAHRAAYQTVGIELNGKQLRQNMGVRTREVVEYWYRRYPWKGPSQKDIEALIIDELINSIKSEGRLRPGVHHALKVCRQAKLPLAIASSSSNEIIDVVVDSLKIRDFFKHIYSADHELFGKPHPGVFITAAGLLGAVPHDVLVFEDAPNGVLAAKAAKMHCIAVPEPEQKDHPFIQTADIIIDSLEEFNQTMLNRFND